MRAVPAEVTVNSKNPGRKRAPKKGPKAAPEAELDDERLDALVDEATVDSHDESERRGRGREGSARPGGTRRDHLLFGVH